MAWRLDGTYFENCNCDVVCPCTVSAFRMPADNDRCNVVLVFHVESGEVEGLDVSGLSVAIVADAPQVMAEGNWRVGVFMDAAASSEQAEALGAVFSGQKGGPMEAVHPLVGEMLGMEAAPIDYVDDGVRHSVKIGEFVELEIEDLVSPADGEVERLTGMAHPANSTLTIAQGRRSRVNAFGIEFSGVDKNAHSAPFSWAA